MGKSYDRRHAAQRARQIGLKSGIALWCLGAASIAQAQTAAPPADQAATSEPQEITVTGIRQTLQTSIAVKRQENAIVDVLDSKQIGDLPALSIGDAIESITGATSHRDHGEATEIALRGLGPFLSNAMFNDREATNGSGDRSVNFSQFPSELINKIEIYKSQQADLIEGGVAGTIELGTVHPLDYGKRLISADIKANYNPYENRIRGASGWGWRGTASYIDQFHLGELGDVGISLGYQHRDINEPEETVAGSSTWFACDPDKPSTGKCNEVSRADAAAGKPFYLAQNSLAFRQISQTDKLDAFIGGLQWQPTSTLDINIDAQYSKRHYIEDRHDLNLSEPTYNLHDVQYDDQHRLLYAEGTTSVEANGNYYERFEKYTGIGGNVSWQPVDRLTIDADLSYSHTKRSTIQRQTRLRTDPKDIYNNKTPINNQRIPYTYDATGTLPTVTFDPRFDPNDWTLFSDDARFRRDDDENRDTIYAARGDVAYEVGGFLKQLKAGARYSWRHTTANSSRNEITQDDRALDAEVNEACRTYFPQQGYMADAPDRSITSWATFDTLCQFRHYLGTEDPGPPADTRGIDSTDVTEKVWAGYVMGTYESALGSTPIRGNFGVRVVDTSLVSRGLRSDLEVVTNPDGSIRLEPTGDFSGVSIKNHYFRVLPSINANFELSHDVIFRAAAYRAMSRPAPTDLSAGRDIRLADGTDFTSIADAIDQIQASGSPKLKPIMSWNGDLALEWYPNKDTIVAGTLYYKQFAGGFIPVVRDEDFVIGGETVSVPVTQRQNSKDKSRIYGIELTLANRFSWLPHPLDGLGAKVSYSHALSNFKNYDINLGDVIDPTTGTVTKGMIPPANITGYSKDVLSAQLYYEIGGLSLQGIYNYRSHYYQDFVGGNSQLRYVSPVGTFDLRASYDVNRNLRLEFQALNLFNENRIDYMPVYGSVRQSYYYGSKYFIGARVRF